MMRLKMAVTRQSSTLARARAVSAMKLTRRKMVKVLGVKITSAVATSNRSTNTQTQTRRAPSTYESALEDGVTVDETFDTV